MVSHILLIGIQLKLATPLEKILSQQGYCVSQITDSFPNLVEVQPLRPDLVIMSLPSKFSLEPCRYLSQAMKNIPVMLLGNDNMQNRIASLNLCANDYLCVPFAIEELLARVRAKLRRANWQKSDAGEVFACAELRLDVQTRQVYRGEQPISLTVKEFDLLTYLMAHSRQVLTHQQILDRVWPDNSLKNNGNILHVYIRCLRQKLKPADDLIQTIRGVGYVLKERSVVPNLFEETSMSSFVQKQKTA